jgi:hypothetical protein
MEGQLLLWFVVPVELADELGHPCAVVTPFGDHDAVVHDLEVLPISRGHVAGVWDFRNCVRIAYGCR